MGYLPCSEMSEAFVHHLTHRGNISIRAAGNRYWRRMRRGYERDDEGHKNSALNALEFTVYLLAEDGWIAPSQPRKTWESLGPYIERVFDLSEEDCKRVFEEGPEELQGLYVVKTCQAYDDGWEWLDPVVWKLSWKARHHPIAIPRQAGVWL